MRGQSGFMHICNSIPVKLLLNFKQGLTQFGIREIRKFVSHQRNGIIQQNPGKRSICLFQDRSAFHLRRRGNPVFFQCCVVYQDRVPVNPIQNHRFIRKLLVQQLIHRQFVGIPQTLIPAAANYHRTLFSLRVFLYTND
ncbi:hypothetical protein D3C86_1791310 [compost metagenome]